MKAQILASASIVFLICSGPALAEGDAVIDVQRATRPRARTIRDPL